jgi:hypothetical protein
VAGLRDVVCSNLRDGFIMPGSSSIDRQRLDATLPQLPRQPFDDL